MEKRFLTAIILSIFVIVVFQIVFPKPKKTAPQFQKSVVRVDEEIVPKETALVTPSFEEVETLVETEKYILTFSDIGGSLKDIKMREYKDTEADSPVHLVENLTPERAIFSLESKSLINNLSRQKFTLEQRGSNKILYTYLQPNRFKIVKEYILHKPSDYIELRVLIKNLGEDTLYSDYELLGASGIRSSALGMGRTFLELAWMIDGKIHRKSRIKGRELFIKGIVSWIGIRERYFCVVLKPQHEVEGVKLIQFDKTNFANGVKTKTRQIYPGATSEDLYALYIGPNDPSRLASLGAEEVVSYGFFGGITKVLLIVLKLFHRIARNWGLAIIMLTFLINVVLFPLTRKSFTSMRKMQEVQPHMEKLRKIHKDNPQKLNKEMAELYRQYKVNPFGGCLPLFLQMPIFFALYQCLMRSIELKGANFLWIKDLSGPDSIHIPFTMPFIGDQIHLLPILTAITMFAQQKLSMKSTSSASKELQQQQNVMLIFFPLFLGFLFYNFPAGFVLYWFTNTVLMLAEHTFLKRASS